ncbi:peptide deformylase [Thermodesulforhabdus norvegica]|uniref:Peptide deformylase n=1 Tax=Thermodesulforhabdus norvegica TaxID=39841 RepID=A0A1I4SM54_9BACT|nr:peptide deformylase [Thermodesulforhabdus norvegica]SFM65363.1 peptide deformylase [Thermodesulforhabdus norvegica]
MALLRIHTYPDPVLKQTAKPVGSVDSSVRKLINDMAETMYDAPGIGLAATQVGDLRRVIVLDLQKPEVQEGLIALVNPVIVHAEGRTKYEEGCLSVPGYYARVKRYERVRVKGLDPDGKEVVIDADGLLAIVLQHEIDHLDGYLFIDRLGPVARELFLRRWKKSKMAQEAGIAG